MATYSFKNVKAAISGPGGSFPLGDDSAAAAEGLTITPTGATNVMLIGADGKGMHSKIANDSGTLTVRLLKTSPVNALLSGMYNLQKLVPGTHGRNSVVVTDIMRGDFTTLSQVAFQKVPELTYASEGGIVEWVFDYISGDILLGVGEPEI